MMCGMSGSVAKVHAANVARVIPVSLWCLATVGTGSGARQGVSGVLDSLAEEYAEVLDTAVTM